MNLREAIMSEHSKANTFNDSRLRMPKKRRISKSLSSASLARRSNWHKEPHGALAGPREKTRHDQVSYEGLNSGVGKKGCS